MLVPLGSFNPVPKILSAIQSDDLENERSALQADCDNMDQAMQIIVDGNSALSAPPARLFVEWQYLARQIRKRISKA
jgi:hypothetical protein